MKGVTVWFTGLPCSGKTTLAWKLNDELKKRGYHPEELDGDITRKYLSKGLGFSKEDRDENIRRVGFVCSLLTRQGAVTTAAFVSPYRSIRAEIRAMIGDFIEVYVKCALDQCIARDVKGMYQKAIAGEIKNFTGISDPYEEPENPELTVETDKESEAECLIKILTKMEELGYLQPETNTVSIPKYLRQELLQYAARENFPDLSTVVIHALGQFLGRQGGGSDLSPDEETAAREKLKKLGYLS